MANEGVSEQLSFQSSVFKCSKCNKRLKNGVQCDQCECSYHFKCGNVSGAPGELKWTCPNCEDKTSPNLLQEISYQELERAYLLLMGECATYKMLYNDINTKFINLNREFDALKSKSPVNAKVNNDANQNVTNCKNKVDKPAKDQQMAEPVSTKVNATNTSTSGPTIIDSEQAPTSNSVGRNVNKQSMTANNLSVEQQNNDDFTLVKRRQRKRPIIGTNNKAKGGLTASLQRKYLHVYRLKEGTTVDQILNYLKDTNDSINFECEKLEARGAYASFKVGYPIEYHDIINNPEFWPEGIAIRPFFLIRNKPTRT